MRLMFRPLGPWTRERSAGRRAQFTASWTDTLELLEREVSMVRRRDQHDEPVVLQVDAPESVMRLDGGIRAGAIVNYHGVILSFESKHGPLRYPCDTFDAIAWSAKNQKAWQCNVRAIALGLEALRTVDRYGIAGDGEQYRGWSALPPGRPMEAAMTLDEAARLLAHHSGLVVHVGAPAEIIQRAYRNAAKRLHPDAGGDPTEFRRVTEARDLLGQSSHD